MGRKYFLYISCPQFVHINNINDYIGFYSIFSKTTLFFAVAMAVADAVTFDIAVAELGNAITSGVAAVARATLPFALTKHFGLGTGYLFNIFSRSITGSFAFLHHIF